jgi:hypothetical protein
LLHRSALAALGTQPPTTTELKQECKKKTLPVGGTKAVLLERLKVHEKESNKSGKKVASKGQKNEADVGDCNSDDDLDEMTVPGE